MHNVKEITPSSSEVNNLYKTIVRWKLKKGLMEFITWTEELVPVYFREIKMTSNNVNKGLVLIGI